MNNLDPKNVLGSTGMLADQCIDIWNLSKSLEFPDKYRDSLDITLCGMGGSRYGAYVIQCLYKDIIKVPFFDYGDYHISAYVNEDSLFIASSYSGGTEEVISSTEEAITKGANVVGLAGGGKLIDITKNNNLPYLNFNQKYNPSGQPRLGTGYMVLGTIAILTKLGYLQVSDEEVRNAVEELKSEQENIMNHAKELADKFKGYIPVIFATDHLVGNAHIMRNQFNETSKSFAVFEEIPELNHHLMEGLKNPSDRKLKILFLSSEKYSEKNAKRLKLTEDVVSQNKVEYLGYKAAGSSKFSEVLNVLSFGSYLSLYLAFNYGLDPSLIPWVDYFKKQLAK